jgi:hypothetical protein
LDIIVGAPPGQEAVMDRETRRREYAEALRAEAAQRFGPERVGALGQAIEDMADWMTEVAEFPVDPEDPPAFYAEPVA